MVSIEKIAKEAKVSSMTVSRVLDPRRVNKVKSTTREKILAICKKYDYLPKHSARALASGKTFTVGLVLNDFAAGLASPTMSVVINSIVKELEEHSYSLNMIYCQGETLEEINAKILNIVYSKRVDGFLFFGQMLTDNSIEKLKKTNIPSVVLSMPSSKVLQENISYVHADNCQATHDAVAHLKNIGVKKPVYIFASIKNFCYERAEMFRRECEAVGLLLGSMTCNYKYRDFQAVFDSFEWTMNNWEELKKYDAYVFSNDQMAIGGAKAIESKGLVLGRDKAVIGFDNIEENMNYVNATPIITTLAPPLQGLGKEAAMLLIRQINSIEQNSVRLTLPSKLIIRRSSQRGDS